MSGTEGGLFGMGLGMWFFWIVFIITLVVMIKVLVGGGSGPTSEHDNSSLEILRGRYARGEIDDEEYQRLKNELER